MPTTTNLTALTALGSLDEEERGVVYGESMPIGLRMAGT